LTPTDAPGLAVSRPVSVPPPATGTITTILQQDEQISHGSPSFPHWADCETESPNLDLDPRLSFYSPQDQPTNTFYCHDEDHLRHDTFPVLAGGVHSDPEAISPVVVNDKDAFAARGLLALISSEDVTPTLGARSGIGPHHGRTASDATPLTRFDDATYADVTITQLVATQGTTELLRHYRYEVAPWVSFSFPPLSIFLLISSLTLVNSSIYAICTNHSALRHFNMLWTQSRFFVPSSYCPKSHSVIRTWIGACQQSSSILPHR
jgi:hypothetical protein